MVVSQSRQEKPEAYGDGNEKNPGFWEETVQIKALPDWVPSPLVICIQSELGVVALECG